MQQNEQTFISVIDANKGIVFKVANAYCRHAEDRKDLIQEILIQLWLSFSKYDDRFKLSTWMYRIALNVSISFYRKESRRSRISHPLTADTIYIENENKDDEAQLAANWLNESVRELKKIDRAVILLYLEEKDHKEIGEILGMTATNVSTRVSRIKQRLTRKFAETKK